MSEDDKKRQLQRRRVRYLLKNLGLEEWIRKIPELEPRTKGGFRYHAVLEPVEYCVRHLLDRNRGMKRRGAIQKVSHTIWRNLSAPPSPARRMTSKSMKTFATHMEELLLRFRPPRVVTIDLRRDRPCISLFCRRDATNRQYNGTNVVLLWMAMRDHKWSTARFVTFKQALELGGHVRKGEHGTKIYFVKDLKFAEENEVDGGDEAAVRSVRMLREYTVFNVDQCEGLPARVTDPPILPPRHHDARDPLIEEFIATTGAEIREDGDKAFYLPSIDTIVIPPFHSFDSGGAYYGTLFHELAHWTDHSSRLNRNFRLRFGNNAYVGEELTAELATAFLCAEFDIDGDPRLSSYIVHYILLLEGDPKAFFTAASKAQQAVDYLRELALRESIPVIPNSRDSGICRRTVPVNN
jgi:antirestriction protein ArdC